MQPRGNPAPNRGLERGRAFQPLRLSINQTRRGVSLALSTPVRSWLTREPIDLPQTGVLGAGHNLSRLKPIHVLHVRRVGEDGTVRTGQRRGSDDVDFGWWDETAARPLVAPVLWMRLYPLARQPLGLGDLFTGHLLLGADGTGSPQPVLAEERSLYQGLWSADGEWIVFRTAGLGPSAQDRGDDHHAFHEDANSKVRRLTMRSG